MREGRKICCSVELEEIIRGGMGMDRAQENREEKEEENYHLLQAVIEDTYNT